MTRRKLLVTGANGFVAGSILAQADNQWEVHAVSRSSAPTLSQSIRWHTFDILQTGVSEKMFLEIKPHIIIHTAAAADIDFCQSNPTLARAVNVDMTRKLAGLCASAKTRLVLCSTDTIFDGEHAPYDEDHAPGPVNIYAETKVEAEQIVSGLGPQGIIARLALVMGLPLMGKGNSFLARLIDSWNAGKIVGAAEHEIRTPVDVITVGKALLELADGTHQGIFHLAGLSRVNRLELNRIIAARFGFPSHLTVAQPAAPGRAPRPRDVSLSTGKTGSELKTPMRTIEEGLSLILDRRHAAKAE